MRRDSYSRNIVIENKFSTAIYIEIWTKIFMTNIKNANLSREIFPMFLFYDTSYLHDGISVRRFEVSQLRADIGILCFTAGHERS